MKKIMLMLSCAVALFLLPALFGCSEVQNEYYEVHAIVVEEAPFYFIDPSEGKSTLKANQLSDGETLFVYLYEPSGGSDFSYDQFFSTIESRWVETNVLDGKRYILANSEIDALINQYFLDKDASTN